MYNESNQTPCRLFCCCWLLAVVVVVVVVVVCLFVCLFVCSFVRSFDCLLLFVVAPKTGIKHE